MKKLTIMAALMLIPVLSMAATSPSEVNIKIYKLWVSRDANCNNLTLIYNNPNATYQNMVAGPEFGEIDVANGAYTCVAWLMSDIISYRPVANDGNDCVANTLYTRDLFRSDNGSGSHTCPDGTVKTGSGTNASPVEDGMCIYLSVSGSNDNEAGHSPSLPFVMGSPFIVNSNKTGEMVTDFTNKISDVGSECDCDAPEFDFR